jgi:hypothetical protein
VQALTTALELGEHHDFIATAIEEQRRGKKSKDVRQICVFANIEGGPVFVLSDRGT